MPVIAPSTHSLHLYEHMSGLAVPGEAGALAMVGVAETMTRAYVVNAADDSVSVIDTAANAVIGTIPVGAGPTGVAADPIGSTVYVVNQHGNSVSVIDTAANAVIGTIPVGSTPVAAAVSPDGATVYVANLGSDSVSVIDTATRMVTADIAIGQGALWSAISAISAFIPTGVAFSPDGATVYVTNAGPQDSGDLGNTVSVIDTGARAVVDTITVGRLPVGVAFSPDGGTAYVTNGLGGSVSVIDTGARAVVDTITVGRLPVGVAFSPDGGTAYVTNVFDDSVSVIDTASREVVPVAVGGMPFWAAVTFLPTSSTTTVTVDPGTALVGQSVTLTAEVSCAGAEPEPPTGSVEFFADGTESLGTVELSNGTAVLSVDDLGAGEHQITARYSGGVHCLPSVSDPAVLRIIKHPSETSVAVDHDTILVGQSVTLTAHVVCSGPGGPTGEVEFFDGGSSLGTSDLAGGFATLTVSTLGVGDHQITARYLGDETCEGSTSPAAVVTVTTTAVQLTAAPNPVLVDQPVTLTARVVCTEGTPTGTVRFMAGTTTLGTATLREGVATFTTRNLAPGTYQVTAAYLGDAHCLPATSAPLAVTVEKGDSVTTVVAIPNPTLRFIPVTLTARVACAGHIPTGTVQFRDGATVIGTSPVIAGIALLITVFRTSGRHQITAVYSGDGHCEGSTSPTLTVNVL